MTPPLTVVGVTHLMNFFFQKIINFLMRTGVKMVYNVKLINNYYCITK